MKLWDERKNLVWFAIIETRKDGLCGVIMTGNSERNLRLALRQMTLARKQPRTSLELIRLVEGAK